MVGIIICFPFVFHPIERR